MLSVIVITKNEQDRIKVCLESVKWADEIIILDNGSTDKTLEIAKNYTDKIFRFENQDYAAFRNKAFGKSSGDWVLYVDPDERVSSFLKNEIEELINDSSYSAYAISRKNIIFGREVTYGPFWPDWVIRLIKRSDFINWVGEVHEYVQFKGKLGYTKNSLIHLTHRDLDQIVSKSLEWSKIEAKQRIDINHPKMSALRFIRILFSSIFFQGIIKRGFFGGTIGVMDSILQTFSTFMTYVRLWQFQQPKTLKEIYDDIDEQLLKNGFRY
ncbi:glycosyltransferase family 2 protein [Candidatus Daviesbacteria bacterium]|nr:glycosyltransferase family 2 protein [Candidatus Daviesbacteria bacterium]